MSEIKKNKINLTGLNLQQPIRSNESVDDGISEVDFTQTSIPTSSPVTEQKSPTPTQPISNIPANNATINKKPVSTKPKLNLPKISLDSIKKGFVVKTNDNIEQKSVVEENTGVKNEKAKISLKNNAIKSDITNIDIKNVETSIHRVGLNNQAKTTDLQKTKKTVQANEIKKEIQNIEIKKELPKVEVTNNKPIAKEIGTNRKISEKNVETSIHRVGLNNQENTTEKKDEDFDKTQDIFKNYESNFKSKRKENNIVERKNNVMKEEKNNKFIKPKLILPKIKHLKIIVPLVLIVGISIITYPIINKKLEESKTSIVDIVTIDKNLKIEDNSTRKDNDTLRTYTTKKKNVLKKIIRDIGGYKFNVKTKIINGKEKLVYKGKIFRTKDQLDRFLIEETFKLKEKKVRNILRDSYKNLLK